MIRGNDDAFYAGATITPFLPITSDAYLSRNNVTNTYEAVTTATNPQLGLYRNQQFTPLSFGSASFPNAASGVTAAIVIGGGNDNAFYGSIQNRIFPAVVPQMPPVEPLPPRESGTGTTLGTQLGTTALVTEQQLDNSSQNVGCRPASQIALGTGSATGQIAGSRAATIATGCAPATADEAAILNILNDAPSGQNKTLKPKP